MELKIKKSNAIYWSWMTISFILLLDTDYTNMVSLGFFSPSVIKLALFVWFLALHFIKKVKFYRTTLFIELAYICIIISTFINGRSIQDAIASFIPSMAMLMFFDFCLHETTYPVFLRVIKSTLLVMVVINFISIIAFPSGMYFKDGYSANWILGYKNVHVRYIIPCVALFMGMRLSRYENLSVWNYILATIGVISCVFARSSTGVIGSVVFVSLVIIDNNKGRITKRIFRFLLNPVFIIIIILTMYYVILEGNTSFLGGVIRKYFGKDLTFTGRIFIWARCFECISKNPIFGVGYLNSSVFYSMINVGAGAHPHNYLIAILFYGGIVSLIIFCLGYISAIWKYQRNSFQTNRVFMWAIIAFLVMGITDIGLFSVLFHPMLLMCGESVQKQRELKK